MKYRKAFIIALAVLLSGAVLAACGGTTLGFYETPKYSVEASEARMEIRSYPALLVAEVKTSGTRKEAINKGFRLLADFIFGNNEPAQKVSMTTPVIQSGGQKIDMTTPVVQSGSEGVWVTQFVMPSSYTLESLPKPNNPAITIKMTDPKKYAVISFSGIANDTKLSFNERKLRGFIEQKGLKAVSDAAYAFYDPPWTLPFMRRNEVMIEVK